MKTTPSARLSNLMISAPPPSHRSAARRLRNCGLAALVGVLAVLSSNPALPQAGVALVKVDVSVVAQGYRMSKLIGGTVVNDKNEKIGSLDDVIAGKDKKQLDYAILQVGGFLGVGARLVAVPFNSFVIDDSGSKITLSGASKDELKKLAEFHY